MLFRAGEGRFRADGIFIAENRQCSPMQHSNTLGGLDVSCLGECDLELMVCCHGEALHGLDELPRHAKILVHDENASDGKEDL